jgi:hypothetical protein
VEFNHADLFENAADRFGDREYIVCDGERRTSTANACLIRWPPAPRELGAEAALAPAGGPIRKNDARASSSLRGLSEAALAPAELPTSSAPDSPNVVSAGWLRYGARGPAPGAGVGGDVPRVAVRAVRLGAHARRRRRQLAAAESPTRP